MTLVAEMLEAWRYTREGVIAEVANFPERSFNKKPDGLGRSALDLVNHIVELSRMMAGELTRPDGDFKRKPYPDLVAEHNEHVDEARNKADAIALLESTFDQDSRLLERSADLLMQPIRQFNGQNATRLVWMHHGVAHEEYHRGQLALYARLFGETPALTKLIEGKS